MRQSAYGCENNKLILRGYGFQNQAGKLVSAKKTPAATVSRRRILPSHSASSKCALLNASTLFFRISLKTETEELLNTDKK